MELPDGEVTQLLRAWSKGDAGAEPRLFELVLPDLQKIAQYLVHNEPPGDSPQPARLLNEAYCRMVDASHREWQIRQDFFAVSARAMRRLLIDRARGREEWPEPSKRKIQQALEVDAALNTIEEYHPDWCSIVELKWFMGCTDEETAAALGLPLRTLQRKFADARRFLFEELESRHAAG